MSALQEWKHGLQAWAIPEPILAAAPESPFGFPVEVFRHRTEAALHRDLSATAQLASEALPLGGSVLDVGAGGGAASLPLAARAGNITAVDPSAELLRELLAAAHAAGAEARTVEGAWPDVAPTVEQAHVVVCSHVLYNVSDLGPFVRALDEHATERVVIELTAEHPLAWMNDLWLQFHGVARPEGPTADTAVQAIAELGIRASRVDHSRSTGGGFERKEDAVALVRRRLCLSPETDDRLEEALGDRITEQDGLWSAGPAAQPIVTLWWDEPSD